ncbi:iron ABC transporter permease [Aeromicrobium wangtongii]|uniref:Iron ABC transporter permease n=2 Tax=Aeromicrobium wangtongii TaxID=2969247 RepID=A0ABY5M7P7_9ACTN|nr:iron ABC transporter permease [Aeromicrobium wangtongii]MCD9198954.1 iron ABC transporter permease [Aeromicrobium wangtongii]UUP13008.1 iron ABC transporter permease [Aeromicrobium wangtongii]
MTATMPERRTTPDTDLPALPASRSRLVTAVFVVLLVAAAVLTVFAAGRGQLEIPAGEVWGSIMHRLGLDLGTMPTHPQGDNTLWQVRFPRIAMALLVGAALAAAGTMMQGIFGNPLAEPSVVGVSTGAAFAAAVVIVFQIQFLGSWTVALFAFVGGLVTTLAVYFLSRADGRTEVVTLVLTGIAVNAVCSAGLAMMIFLGDTAAREQIIFWQLGSLNGTRWDHVWVVAPLVVLGIVGTMLMARKLDVLSLGDRAARHVGIDVERLRLVAIVLVALLTAAAVAFAGIIAFVGLVVPHLMRMILGPGHRVLVPASALAGAVLLLGADLIARTAMAYADLPIGMLTSLVGGPFFFWLLRRTRKSAGGWA